MGNEISKLLKEIRVARARILGEVSGLSQDQGSKKPNLESWNIQEVLEHLVLAERGGFDLICTAAERFRNGNPVWTGISENDNMPIEEIIQRTWKPKEKAPESAFPTGKWSLRIWASHLSNCDDLLKDLLDVLEDLPLQKVIYPHFLCGPLNAIQRLEFIRFHLDRHQLQVLQIKKINGF